LGDVALLLPACLANTFVQWFCLVLSHFALRARRPGSARARKAAAGKIANTSNHAQGQRLCSCFTINMAG
jgi:hypothetical protein